MWFISSEMLISFGFRYVLESEHVKKFFDYIQLANFDIAADAAATFKVLKNILTFSLFIFSWWHYQVSNMQW